MSIKPNFNYLNLGPGNNEQLINIVDNQKKSFAIVFISAGIGLSTLTMFGLFFNIVEVAQEINFYLFFNQIKPINIDDLLEFLSQFMFFHHSKMFEIINLKHKGDTQKKIYHLAMIRYHLRS